MNVFEAIEALERIDRLKVDNPTKDKLRAELMYTNQAKRPKRRKNNNMRDMIAQFFAARNNAWASSREIAISIGTDIDKTHAYVHHATTRGMLELSVVDVEPGTYTGYRKTLKQFRMARPDAPIPDPPKPVITVAPTPVLKRDKMKSFVESFFIANGNAWGSASEIAKFLNFPPSRIYVYIQHCQAHGLLESGTIEQTPTTENGWHRTLTVFRWKEGK